MPRTETTKQSLYLDQTFGHEDSLLKLIKEMTVKEGVQRMQISSHEGRILQTLARSIKAKKIVEIGSLYCYSTVYLARGLTKGEGKVFTCDVSEKRHQMSKSLIKNYPEHKNIEWLTGDASKTLSQIENEGPFDMVFIDADKNSYGLYLKWAEKNLRNGGLLLADNSFLFGSVYDNSEKANEKTVKIMQDFNSYLSNSKHWLAALIPTKEGLTFAIRQIDV